VLGFRSFAGGYSEAASVSRHAVSFAEIRNMLYERTAPVGADVDFETKMQILNEEHTYRGGLLPHYTVSAGQFLKGGVNLLVQSAQRTVAPDSLDYYDRIEKLVHPNGICFTGEWKINQLSKYTGLFAPNTKALFVGRASAASSETDFKDVRGFGFAGKIFPTLNENELVQTASFFTVDTLPGERDKYFSTAVLSNEPEVNALWHPFTIPLLLKISKALTQADENPGFRPVAQLAKTQLSINEAVVAPKWLRLTFVQDHYFPGETDFRRELILANQWAGNSPSHTLAIDVADPANSKSKAKWQRIGSIELKESITSYGCDRRLHFSHPKLEK
jgi:hypothetical protein